MHARELIEAMTLGLEMLEQRAEEERRRAAKLADVRMTPEERAALLAKQCDIQRDLLSRALTALRNSNPKNGEATDQHSYVRRAISDHLRSTAA